MGDTTAKLWPAKITAAIGVALWLSLVGPSAAAQLDVTWTGNGDGQNWNTAANWDLNQVPNNAANTYRVRIDNNLAVNSAVTISGSAAIDALTVDAGDSLTLGNFLTLSVVAGSVANNGTINLQAAGNATNFRFATGTTLNGSGQLVLGGSDNNRVYGLGSPDLLTNGPMHTISGGGRLGFIGNLTLDNQGLIDANNVAGLLPKRRSMCYESLRSPAGRGDSR